MDENIWYIFKETQETTPLLDIICSISNFKNKCVYNTHAQFSTIPNKMLNIPHTKENV